MLIFASALLLAALAATLSATTGLAGGALLLAGLSLFLEPVSVVAHHAATQGPTGLLRVWVFRRSVRWRLSRALLVSSLIGVAFGFPVLALLPRWAFVLLVAGTALVTALRKSDEKPAPLSTPMVVVLGITCGFVGTVAGASGPLLSSLLLRLNVQGEEHVATKAAVQSVTHFAKIAGLLAAGLTGLEPVLMTALLAGALLGTLAGKQVSERVSIRAKLISTRAALGAVAVLLLVGLWRT
ncbi:MAG: TSUP family transporter [Myxococcota bacterium]